MIILAAPLLLIGAVVAFYKPPPPLKTPMELAAWSRCELPRLTDYLDRGVEYRVQEDGWQTSEAILARRHGDCKGKALIARDTLLACGYEDVHIVTIRRGVGAGLVRHVVVLFQNPKSGRRGYVDASIYRTYDPGTPWADVVGDEARWRDWQLESN